MTGVLLTSLLRYESSDSVSFSSVTAHFPRMWVAGSVSTWRDRNSSRCFSWCCCFSDSSSLTGFISSS